MLHPAVSGNITVCYDGRNRNYDIYLAAISEPTTPPLLGLGGMMVPKKH